MYKLSKRCEILREEMVNKKEMQKKICANREVLFVEGVNAAPEGKNNYVYVAAGLSNVLRKMKAVIMPGELIVGYNYGDTHKSECWMAAFEIGFPRSEERAEDMRACGFTEEEIETYFATWDNARNRVRRGNPVAYLDRDIIMRAERAGQGHCVTSNHSVIMYEDVIKYGFSGLLEKVKKYEAINGTSDFYDGVKEVCSAACTLGKRYADEAERMACEDDITDEQREELKRIAEVCRRVPEYPAETFHDAVQSVWFAHLINTLEDTVNANSVGRLDQILYPYYKKDIEEGRLTKEEAFEIICCLWLKLYRDYDVQQSCVGGCDRDGNEAVNDLSYLMLDATEQLDFIRCMSVRYSQKTDKKFLKRALEVVGHVQKGVPFFFNDDVMIPALCYKGIPIEDAREYTQIGCVETVIPGKSNPHAVTGETNLLKAVEFALNEGRSMMNEESGVVLETPSIDQYTTYEALEAAVLAHIENIIDSSCRQVSLWTEEVKDLDVKPYKSLLTRGCIENNLDFNSHGALYDYYQIMLGGIPNVADSLMAIKKLVYEEKRYTLEEIVEQLKNDFPDEAIRQDLLNHAPKFGNDIDEVDSIAVKITDYCCDYLLRMDEKYGLSFHAQPFTFLWMIDDGKVTAASADGRRAGEPTAYSASPMQGRDFNGLTSLMNSISKFPTKKTPGTTSAIVEADPLLFSDANIDYFVDMLLVSGEKGISNVQFNVTDAKTLMAAQKEPEKYRNLAVRVSGFSQKFVLLDKALQDHIIGRTKHKCM